MTSIERRYQQAAAWALQDQQGYYPLELVSPELDAALIRFEVRLAQETTSGPLAVMLMTVLDADQRRRFQTGKLKEELLGILRTASQSAPAVPCRFIVVLVGEEPLGPEARTLRGTPPLSRRPLREVAFYWVSPRAKRFQSGYHFFSLARNRELNPCDPEPNLFSSLLRRGWTEVRGQAHPARQVHELERERFFSERLLSRPVAVWLLVAANVLVWMLSESHGGSTNLGVLIRLGAKVDGLIEAGQWWRFVTPTFLHAGLAHLILNTLVLVALGQTMERLYGSVQFVLLYFVSGILAAAASFYTSHGAMVGASGAIFGIVGALVVYGWRHRKDIPARYKAMFGGGLLPVVALNVILGFLIPQIDNAAHIGGMVAGGLCVLLLWPRTSPTAPRFQRYGRRIAFVILAGVVAVSGVEAGVFFRKYPNLPAVDEAFVLRRVFGPVRAEVPATWTVTPVRRWAWSLQGTATGAAVEIFPTRQPIGDALKRIATHLEAGGIRTLPLQALGALQQLQLTGRCRFSFLAAGSQGGREITMLTYVTTEGVLAELAVRLSETESVEAQRWLPVLTRLADSFEAVNPTTPAPPGTETEQPANPVEPFAPDRVSLPATDAPTDLMRN